ncbi:uncharacterized protein TNCV_1928731 [Trichonephila clavipes]|nr:uncharacterized protein TNCV_1928731 [Trichonephila clavipes]
MDTNAELADMHLAYGAANCSGPAAQRLYAERYPMRRIPSHNFFARLHQRLAETGSFERADMVRVRTARTPAVEQNVLQHVEKNPRTSTRSVANSVEVSHCSVWRILREQDMHPFHVQRVQTQQPEDYAPRVAFAQWYLGKCATNPLFPDEVLFSDEASFKREGIFNTHNDHIWAVENPHAIRLRAAHIRFSVNVWAGIMGDHLIGPYLFPCRLTGLNYLLFLQQVLSQLLRDEQISASTQQTMWFQHDGAPAHFSGDVRNYLDVTFGQQWIGRGGPVRWPAWSPDLSCLDFYFWGHMKSLVYDTPVDNAEELVARIAVAAGEIRNSPGVFQNVRMSKRRRCEACIVARGRNFEHLL